MTAEQTKPSSVDFERPMWRSAGDNGARADQLGRGVPDSTQQTATQTRESCDGVSNRRLRLATGQAVIISAHDFMADQDTTIPDTAS